MTAALTRAGIGLRHVGGLDEARGLAGLLCLWDSADVAVARRASDLTTAALTQLQLAVATGFAPALVWVTRQAVGAGDHDGAPGLAAGPLWGLMRTARSEHPALGLRAVDLPGEAAPDQGACAAALTLGAEPECAVRRGRVLVPRLRHAAAQPGPPGGRLVRPGGGVLVTDGLGHLGRCVARWLVRSHGVDDVVLASRRGPAAPGAAALVADLGRLGARATVVAADVANRRGAKSLVALFGGQRPLRGVLHLAGVVASGVLSTLSPERCAPAFAPKVEGAWHLHQLTRQLDLDFVVFSSVSGALGMPGLGIYAAANAFLDSLAHLRRGLGLTATSVAYGPWQGPGMAAGLVPTARAHLARFGLDMLTPASGLDLLGRAVRSRRSPTVAAALDLGRLRAHLEQQPAVPPLFRSLVGGGGSRRPPDLHAALREDAPEQRGATMLRKVCKVVGAALGFARAEHVDVDRRLRDVGLDSLTAVLVRNQLAALTGLSLSANITFQHPSVRALSRFLLSRLDDGSRETSEVAGPGPRYRLDMAAMRRGCVDQDLAFPSAAGAPRRPEAVLVTGATGFVGAFVVHELLQQGIVVHCIVRASGAEHARARLVDTLEGYGIWEPGYASQLHAVVGDLAQPLLGLNEEAFDDLAARVDVVCHSGALVTWMRPLDDYVGPNLVSTHEVLRLASRGRVKAIHVVSTVATLPWHRGHDVSEDEYEFGYGSSKWTAERMVAAAPRRASTVCPWSPPRPLRATSVATAATSCTTSLSGASKWAASRRWMLICPWCSRSTTWPRPS